MHLLSPSVFSMPHQLVSSSTFIFSWCLTTTHGPWTLLDLNRTLEPSEVYQSCSNYHCVSNISFCTLIGRYKDKNIHWHPSNQQWQYINNRPVIFTLTPKLSWTRSFTRFFGYFA